MAKKMSTIDWIAFVLVVVGGLNWGLVGFFGLNVVEAVLGMGMITNIVYDLVGISALYSIYCIAKK